MKAKDAYRPALFLAALVAMYLRAPEIFSSPRLWAEEGRVYFAFAFSHPFLEALLAPHLGYFSLVPNLATALAAKALPLEHAPVATTLIAFAVQALPLAVVVWGRADLWEKPGGKALAVAIVLFTPSTGESWVNTITSQFHLGLAALLVFLEGADALSRGRAWFHRAILAVGGLTGVISTVLAPLFVLRAACRREREAVVQAAILSACALLQLAVFASVAGEGGEGEGIAKRLAGVGVPTAAAIAWTNTVAQPFLGGAAAEEFGRTIYTVSTAGEREFRALGWMLLLLLIAFVELLGWRESARGRYLILAWLLLMGVSISFATGSDLRGGKFALVFARYAPRYFHVPSVILLLLAAGSLRFDRGALRSGRAIACAALMATALFFGVRDWREIHDRAAGAPGPEWKSEIGNWRAHPDREVRIRPDGWTLRLERK